MSVLILPKYYSSQKPPLGSQLNFGHPLAQGLVGCWLMNEGGGTKATDIARNLALPFYQSSQSFGVGFDSGAKTKATNEGVGVLSPSYLKLQAPFSIVWRGQFTAGSSNNGRFFSMAYDGVVNTAPYTSYGFSTGATPKYNLFFANGGTLIKMDSGVTLIIGKIITLVAVFRSNSDRELYLNGISIDYDNTAYSNIGYSSDSHILFGSESFSGRTTNAIHYLGYIYNRTLSVSEIQSLYVAPYQFIQPPRRRFYSLPTAAPSTQTYTRGASGTLPSDDTDLATAYSAQDYLDVATADDTRVSIVGGNNEYTIHQFKDNVGGLTTVNLSWEGQTSVGPPPLTVYLQIYNINTTTWDTLDSKTSVASNTDFQLVKSSLSLTNYKNGSNFISCRVYQLKEVPSATTLRTDLWAIPTAPASPTVGLHQFIMCN